MLVKNSHASAWTDDPVGQTVASYFSPVFLCLSQVGATYILCLDLDRARGVPDRGHGGQSSAAGVTGGARATHLPWIRVLCCPPRRGLATRHLGPRAAVHPWFPNTQVQTWSF